MAIKTIINKYYLLCISIICLVFAGYTNLQINPPPFRITKQQSAVNIHHDFIKVFSVGQHRLLSSFLWISTLLESDLDQYNRKDLGSWMYLRFNSIIALDPYFMRAYQFGGKYLSIVKDDLLGAKEIFQKGLLVYPKNYELLYNYAFLLAFELGEYEAAVDIYMKLLNYPQLPVFIPTLMAKLNYKAGQNLADTYKILNSIYNKEPAGTYLKTKIAKDLYAIKAQLDLECLNAKQSDCSKFDFEGEMYRYRNGIYFAAKPFKRYQFHKKIRKKKEKNKE